MNSQQQHEVGYRFGPPQYVKFMGLTSYQVVTFVIVVVIAFALLKTLGLIYAAPLSLVVMAIAAAFVIKPYDGTPLVEWIPITLRWLAAHVLRLRRFRTAAPHVGFAYGADGAEGICDLPRALENVELIGAPFYSDEIGVLVDHEVGGYTAALLVGGTPFPLLDSSEQQMLCSAWGDVQARLAREDGIVRRLQVIDRTLPGDSDALVSYLTEQIGDSVEILNQMPARSLMSLVGNAAEAQQDHQIIVALQIDGARARRHAKRLGGGREGICRVLGREIENLVRNLDDAGITVYGALNPRRLAQVVNSMYDPFDTAQEVLLGTGLEPAVMGPDAADINWSSYHADSAIHATYWIAQWPGRDVGTEFMAPVLLRTSCVRSISVTMEPVKPSTAIRQAEGAHSSALSDEHIRNEQQRLTTARDRRQYESAVQTEEELSVGHQAVRFSGYVTVSGRDEEDFSRACAEIENAAQQSGLKLRVLRGYQDIAFTYTLPICRGR
jgi:hypothetical protein